MAATAPAPAPGATTTDLAEPASPAPRPGPGVARPGALPGMDARSGRGQDARPPAGRYLAPVASPALAEPGESYDSSMATAGRRRILLVEDEESITRPLSDALRREGFDTEIAETAEEALDMGRRLAPDLILLDLMLPDGSGFDVCRELRRTSDVPIVMLTARGEEADRIVGLEMGADDYVVKPFSAREVVARIRAVLRRSRTAGGEEATGPLDVGAVRLDPERHAAELDGEELDLSRKEFELLHRLMRDAGSVVTREQLIDDVWDVNWFGSTKTLDVHVSSLRKKLGDDPSEPRYLHTVRGVGFRFSSPDEAER
jgi:two-component system response regulator RegX3